MSFSGRRAAYDLGEARTLVQRSRPEERGRAVASRWFIDRIGLEHPDLLLPRETNYRGVKTVLPPTAATIGYARAMRAPHFAVVNGIHDPRTCFAESALGSRLIPPAGPRSHIQ